MLDSLDGFALSLAAERLRPATIDKYLSCLRRLHAALAAEGYSSWDQVTRTSVNRFLASLMQTSASNQAVHHNAIRKFSSYLTAEEGLGRPLLEGKSPRVIPKPLAFPREEQLRALLRACKDRPRDEAIIRMMADAGLRRSEVHGLKVEDLDVSAAPRVLVHGKGGKDRYVAVGNKTALALRRYLRQRASHPYARSPQLWLGRKGPLSYRRIYEVVQEAGERAGVPVRPHLLRHSWAHHFRASGGQLDDLVHLAGWSSANMALRYGASAAGERAEEAARRVSLGDRL